MPQCLRTIHKKNIQERATSKAKENDQSHELQFWTIIPEILQARSIGKENFGVHISTPKEAKQSTEVEMDVEIEVEVEVDITEVANSRGISVQKLVKQLYKEGNLAIGLLEEESRKFD